MTELLYNTSAYIKSFCATVLSCKENDGCYAVTLDKSAFFPEQGGQYADEGTLGDAVVSDVQIREGVLYHITDRAVNVGDSIKCEINFEKRYDRMQNHTGEHILSGYFYKAFGYENVGFHLNDDFMTLDTSGALTKEQLSDAEDFANRAVFRNLPITAYFPDESTLATLDYRSKSDLAGKVRIVSIQDIDHCACCAPHVAQTGEVGMIKIVDAIRYKGGMRLTVLCGMRALRDYRTSHDILSSVGATLSVKRGEVGDGVARLQAQLADAKHELVIAKQKMIEYKIKAVPTTLGNLCLFEEDMDISMLRLLVNGLLLKCSGLCAAFSGDDTNGYQFVIGAENIPLRAHAKAITEALCGRGGGNDRMLSGNARTSADVIRKYIEEFQIERQERKQLQ